MARSLPQRVSVAAVAIGIVLFVATLASIDLSDTIASLRPLGLAVPLILLPGLVWHLLRTWGWAIAFPDDTRPSFAHLFRVRLAADAISYFTIRGVTGDPLKVVLLYGRTPPEVTTAAVALERLAFAVVGTLMSGVIAIVAIRQLPLPPGWNAVFVLLSVTAVILAAGLAIVVRRGSGDYLGRLVEPMDRLIGRRLETSRVVRFVLDVEDILLALLRGERRRLVLLTVLPVVGYVLMTIEVWLVLWAVGVEVTMTEVLAIETFARLASVASAAIPANLGALEASNAAVVGALGLGGGGALALTRRVRSLLWAGLGLLLYPRPPAAAPGPPARSPSGCAQE